MEDTNNNTRYLVVRTKDHYEVRKPIPGTENYHPYGRKYTDRSIVNLLTTRRKGISYIFDESAKSLEEMLSKPL